ncbi:MAG: T9SS type A sorting domain-containing protein [Bacteroidales bacterium]|jgi:hypothetical protein|nr:T9SS type A sorting domain-containing protein [Bacteroidales bacterium]
MQKTILFFSFFIYCFTVLSQNYICVDCNSSGSENGTPSNPYRTIQAAVNAASNGDIIKVAKGAYSEAVQISQKKVQLLGGFAGNGIFDSADPQANITIINGTIAAPCILVYIDAQAISGSLIISGFTIQNGQRGIELSGEYSGFLNNITIENNIIENNGTQDTDKRGGGIGLEGNDVTIKNNIIRNNKSGRGAAIGVTSGAPDNFVIACNRIENNTGYGDHAGGVIINGTGTITENIFDGNIAAAAYDYGWGGGILVFNYDTTKLITLSHNVWRNNQAPSRGGAVFIDEAGKVKMEHELFYNNKTEKSGSAIYVDADYNYNPSVLYMDNCTVSENATDAGEAALFVQESIAHVQNCIFWNNSKDFELVTEGEAHTELTVNYTLTQQGFTGTGNFSSDPLFADASNGDFHVKSKNGRYDPSTGQFVKDGVNSPAIDAGNPSSDFSKEPQPNGSRVNLGCYGNTAEASKSESEGNEEFMQILWTIVPNPAKENITIYHLPIGSSVNITEITGKRVYSSVIKTEQTTISVEEFVNGIYIIQVSYDGSVTNRKLIISR